MSSRDERSSLRRALLLAGAWPVVLLATLLGAKAFLGIEPIFEASNRAFAILGVALGVHAAVLWFLIVKVLRRRLRDLGWSSAAPTRDVLLGVAGLAVVAAILFALVTAAGDSAANLRDEIVGFSVRQRVLFVLIGIDAAMLEESIFRGCVQPAMVARWGPVAGVAVTATLHALGHLDFHPARLVGLVAISSVYGVLRWRTGSLVAPGAAHALTWAVFGSA